MRRVDGRTWFEGLTPELLGLPWFPEVWWMLKLEKSNLQLVILSEEWSPPVKGFFRLQFLHNADKR